MASPKGRQVPMNGPDQSIAAAPRPHRQDGDEVSRKKEEPEPPGAPGGATERSAGLWDRIRGIFAPAPPSLRDSLRLALQGEGDEANSFSESERIMLANVLKLAGMRVEDVMVPRVDIEAVDDEESLGQLVEKFRQSGHSRLPVYSENMDNITGMIHIKDALQHLSAPVERPNGSPIKLLNPALKQKLKSLKCTREVLFVPPSMPVGDLLQSMQATRLHMAIVVDEYGGTDGLVSIEDLLEAVVGDIEDEHDDQETALVVREGENAYCADARASLEELRQVIGPDFDPGEISQEVDTLGGLVFSLIDRIPLRAEVITRMKGFEFEILQADPRRIRKVRILRKPRKLNVRGKARVGAKTGVGAGGQNLEETAPLAVKSASR